MAEETSASTTYIERLECIVIEHMNREDFDVESFAQLAGYSRSELYRKIKKGTGKSVTQFVRDIRLEKALKLLKDGHLTASQVAFEVGFNSATYFNKCFKEKYGFTPGDTAYHPNEINELLGKRYAIQPKEKESPRPYLIVLIVMAFLAVGAIGFFSNDQKGPEIAATSSQTTSIAVMPLLNFTSDPQNDALARGIREEIIIAINNRADLIKQQDIRFIDLDNMEDLPPEEQGADLVIQGSLQSTAAQVKVNIFCIDPKTAIHIWDESIVMEFDPNTPFEIQTAVANRVTAKLNINNDDYYPHKDQVNTSSDLATKYYHQAMEQSLSGTRDSWERAIELYQMAIDEDSLFTEAYIRLAGEWASGGTVSAYIPQKQAWKAFVPILRKALQMDPDDQLALYTFKDCLFYYGLNVRSNYPELSQVSFEDHKTFNTDFATKTGDFQKAHEGHLFYKQRYPKMGLVDVLMAINWTFLQEHEHAKEIMNENYPIYKDEMNFLREAIKAYYFLGEEEKMEAALSHYLTTFEERSPIISWVTAIVADRNGDHETRNAQLVALDQAYSNEESGSPAWFLALYAAYEDDYDKCLDWLERSYEAREVEMTWLAQEPDLSPLGSSERYQALLDSMNFPQSARTHVINATKLVKQ
ncbi:helix-turn-helix domain-containing protein [Robertkochia sediminum]|uniref:helix-turn-helix domain-containing protein n=1 Tax=Robertkochia sediminum TaxID=2785326 RepID=UPI0019349A72|nr:helix-turn-helix domain-containing protein [Robertkochia sediminum]MBL7473477.1 helix-turn-helix domain-containing protein [Robertkochia sediminum]